MYSQVQTLLTQFRTRYPMGSLVSELLTTYQDQYVVRVSVQMGGVTLATGLAAAANIETAEDRARERSLEALGILHTPLLTTNLPAHLMPERSPDSSRLPETPGLVSEPTLNTPLEPVTAPLHAMPTGITSPELTAAPIANPTVAHPAEERSLSAIPPMPVIADFYTHATADPDPLEPNRALLDAGSISKLQVSDRPAPKPQSRVKEQPSPFSVAPVTSVAPPHDSDPQVDLSEVLAQIDVEMRRLGWTRKQGREHLKQSYGKETRSELEIEELFDFLQYLESQPA